MTEEEAHELWLSDRAGAIAQLAIEDAKERALNLGEEAHLKAAARKLVDDQTQASERFLTLPEAAVWLRERGIMDVSASHLADCAKAGTLRATKPGRSWHISEADLMDFLEACRAPQKDPSSNSTALTRSTVRRGVQSSQRTATTQNGTNTGSDVSTRSALNSAANLIKHSRTS
jgi:excisionase family DNA binding protein